MDYAAAVRETAVEAVADIEPAAFRDDIEAFLAEGSLVPGVLTLLAAESAGGDPGALTERAVGVQLIYDGLRLTRRLTHEDPWASGGKAQADLDILAADVLVSRGFFLLARTEAAEDAVEVVRAFGRDQTRRRTADNPEALDTELEADVLRLALVAGTTAAGETPGETGPLAREFAASYDDEGGFPSPAALFDDGARERIAAAAGGRRPLNRND
jgi:hypothetical protein